MTRLSPIGTVPNIKFAVDNKILLSTSVPSSNESAEATLTLNVTVVIVDKTKYNRYTYPIAFLIFQCR